MQSIIVWRDRMGLTEVSVDDGTIPTVRTICPGEYGRTERWVTTWPTLPIALEKGFVALSSRRLGETAALLWDETDPTCLAVSGEDDRLPVTLRVRPYDTSSGRSFLVSRIHDDEHGRFEIAIGISADPDRITQIVSAIGLLVERSLVDMLVAIERERVKPDLSTQEGRHWTVERHLPIGRTIKRKVVDLGLGLDDDHVETTEAVIAVGAVVAASMHNWLSHQPIIALVPDLA